MRWLRQLKLPIQMMSFSIMQCVSRQDAEHAVKVHMVLQGSLVVEAVVVVKALALDFV